MTRLERASHIAQIIAAAGVILSVVYLALQIRDTNRVTRASVRHELTADLVETARLWTDNGDMAELWAREAEGVLLTPAERMRLSAVAYVDMRVWENVHYQHSQGLLSDEEFASFRRNLRFLMQHRVYQDFWQIEREIFTDRFRDMVDELLTEIEAGSPVVTREPEAIHPEATANEVRD